MGAKTNKFIQDIEKATLGFAPYVLEIQRYKELIAKLIPEAEKSLAQFNKRVAELEKQFGAKAHEATAQGQALEKAIQGGDKVMAAIEKADDERNKRLTAGNKGKLKAYDALKKLYNPFVKELDEFEQYVLKKEKSKNPFKSKNSLPEAKKFIARMRVVQKDILRMVT